MAQYESVWNQHPYHLWYPTLYPEVGKDMILDRITLDIDYYENNFQLKALRAYHGIRRLDFVESVVIHISTSGRGLHIEAHLTRVLDKEDRNKVRRTLCDDTKRTDLDVERGDYGHATGICWTEKEGNDGEREEVDGIWLALDRLESARASDHARVKALALHGRKGVWDTHGLNRPSMAEEC